MANPRVHGRFFQLVTDNPDDISDEDINEAWEEHKKKSRNQQFEATKGMLAEAFGDPPFGLSGLLEAANSFHDILDASRD